MERTASLEPSLTSPREARRLLHEFLVEAGHDGWLEAGELAISEVVTNAALHAHTAMELRLLVYPDRACVEVRDFSTSLPQERHYADQATTGRGMALVSTITLDCGVESLGSDGKVVWFCVGDPPERSVDDLLAAWDLNVDDLHGADATGDELAVTLLALPPTLWLSAQQHHDAMIRELVLHQATNGGPQLAIVSADEARSILAAAVTAALTDAEAAGGTQPAVPPGHPSPLPWVPANLDLTLSVTHEVAGRFAALQDVLDAAEALAVDGLLLMRPGLPEIVAVRDWACEQVIAQAAGMPPVPWAGTAQERFETDVRGGTDMAWDSSLITGSDRGVVAADDANRIVAISRPLSDLLGWNRNDLVGRRVVTLIPPSLREAHVAGFSRHLSTGEAHVLGVLLNLPVLHKDGSETLCRFLVEQAPSNSGRSLYLAWIEPVLDRSSPADS